MNVILVDQVFLNPEVIITGWKEHNFLFIVIVSAAENIYGMVEKLALISYHNSVSEHFSLLPFLNSVSTPSMDSNKDKIFLKFRVSYRLYHPVGKKGYSFLEYKLLPKFLKNFWKIEYPNLFIWSVSDIPFKEEQRHCMMAKTY